MIQHKSESERSSKEKEIGEEKSNSETQQLLIRMEFEGWTIFFLYILMVQHREVSGSKLSGDTLGDSSHLS